MFVISDPSFAVFFTFTVKVTVLLPVLAAKESIVHTTWFPFNVPPSLALINDTLLKSKSSLTVTFLAIPSPVLVTVIV